MAKEEDKDLKLIDQALQLLGEHFDSVQILATRHESATHDGTINIAKGVGNWFARYGQCVDFVHKQDAYQVKNINEERL